MEFPILYKNNRFWKIYVQSISPQKSAIYTEYGQINGKITKTQPIFIEKSIGKQSVLDRAITLAQTKWNNKITTDGYKQQQTSNSTFSPMKPANWEKYNDKIVYPAFLQPKLDGVRMYAFMDGTLQTLSRQNKPINNIPHIREHLEKIFQKYPNIILDGELLIANQQKELRGLLSKKYLNQNNHIKIQKISYNIFDLIEKNNPNSIFKSRWELATKITKECNNINIVPTFTVNSKKEVNTLFNELIEQGYEGAVIRNMNSVYRMGKVSQNTQKIKLYFMDEFTITGYQEGQGSNKGTVIWEVKCLKNPNRKFKVRPMGTRESKRRLLEDAEEFIGKKLEVYFYEKDEDGCVVRVKTAEDLTQK